MNPWVAYGLGLYGLITATMLFLTWPYADSGEVPKRTVLRDSFGWPVWALILIVEAAEEARRSIRNRVE